MISHAGGDGRNEEARARSQGSLRQQRAGEVFRAVEELNRALKAAAAAGVRVELEEVPVETICEPPRPHVRAKCWTEVVE